MRRNKLEEGKNNFPINSIRKFHSKIRSSNENTALFKAFRKLNNVENPVKTLVSELQSVLGWPEWYFESL